MTGSPVDHSDPGEEGTNDDVQDLTFLMHRYDQLLEEQMSTNEMVHNTFYISVVVFGALVGVVPQLSSLFARATVYLFASAIFVAMFFWTRTYLNSRQEVETQMRRVVESVERLETQAEALGPTAQFFSTPADFRQERWEQDWLKERALMLYYLSLSAFSLATFALDLALNALRVDLPGVVALSL